MTVLDWLTERRMAEAHRRLHETDKDVAIVGERAGYLAPAYFARRFRRTHGISARAYGNACRLSIHARYVIAPACQADTPRAGVHAIAAAHARRRDGQRATSTRRSSSQRAICARDPRRAPAMHTTAAMPQTITRALAAALLAFPLTVASAPARADPPRKPVDLRAAIEPMATRLIDGHYCGGLVVALISPDGPPQILAWGETVRGNGKLPDGNTIFEIGSVTKLFTSLVLAEMVVDHQVKLDTPVSALLPNTRLPTGKRAITLLDLATHTAGLPAMPDNLHRVEGDHAYAEYTSDRLLEFLATTTLTSEPGEKYQYSNVGAGLLGLALARRARTDWAALVAAQITRPLAMTSTLAALDGQARTRFAQGYDADGEPAPPLDFPGLAGAGALHSTALDLIKFVKAELAAASRPTSRLAKAMALTQTPRHDLDDHPEHGAVGLAWTLKSNGMIWHNGQTLGHHSLISIVPSRGLGVVVLASGAAAMIDWVGVVALAALQGEPVPPGLDLPPPEIPVDDKVLKSYVGSYELEHDLTLTISYHDGKLAAELPHQPGLRLHPSSPTELWAHVFPVHLTFEVDAQHKVTGVVLHQPGNDLHGRRR